MDYCVMRDMRGINTPHFATISKSFDKGYYSLYRNRHKILIVNKFDFSTRKIAIL